MESKEITFAITIKHEGEDWWLAKYTPKHDKQKWPVQQWSSLPEDAMTDFKTLHEADCSTPEKIIARAIEIWKTDQDNAALIDKTASKR